MAERAPETPYERIPSELHRAVAEITEQIEHLGHVVTLVRVEAYNRDHYIVNLDTTTVEGPQGSPEQVQGSLKQIDERTTDHAAEVAISVQEGPEVTAEGVDWELEAMIRITEQGG